MTTCLDCGCPLPGQAMRCEPSCKPAATGSGEPKCNNPLHAMTDGTLHQHEIGASCMAGATPPASQLTVRDVLTSDMTLLAEWANQQSGTGDVKAREAFNMLGHWAIIAAQYAPHRFLLALLRAAERGK